MTQVDLLALLQKQQQAHLNAPYPDSSIRKDRLDRLADMVIKNQQKICDAVMSDFGCRSAINTKASDIFPVVEASKHAKKKIVRWMRPQRRKSKFGLNWLGAKSFVYYQPLGVVGNISAWNFPIQLSLAPLADIFAAGNRAMLKPSELSEQTSQLLAEIVKKSFDEDELAIVLGKADVAAQFSSLPFDHLLFTGSTHVGKLVAQAAAANLVPVTLELGGKNPVIVSNSADITQAAQKVMWAKTLNGGQICLSPDTVIVHAEKVQDFISACQQSVANMYPNIETDEDYTHVISEQHAQRLTKMVDEAASQGAKITSLGATTSRCVPPSLILEPELNSNLMTEEVFGGPLPIIPYVDIEQAITFINARPKPLALYYFGTDESEINAVTNRTSSGGLVINDCMSHHLEEDLPFGGVGNSGMGAYHGFDGFKNFSHARAVHRQSKFDPLRIIRPPYSKLLRRYIDKQLKS